MEKQMLCISRLAIWAKYCSHCIIYNANKTHSSLLGEKMYLNNRLPRQLANPGFLHKRLKSKHWTNARPSPVARFRRKLGEVHSSLHLVIDISVPLHRFTDNVTQSPRDKDPEHTESKWQTLILNSTPSACKVASLIGRLEAACPSIWQAPLHYRGLQIQLIKSLRASRDNYFFKSVTMLVKVSPTVIPNRRVLSRATRSSSNRNVESESLCSQKM